MGEGAAMDDGELVALSRRVAREQARLDAEQLVLVDRIASRVRQRAALEGDCDDLVDMLVVDEVQATLGVTEWAADAWVRLATRCARSMPRLLAALHDGVVDLNRVRIVVDRCEGLDDAAAVEVSDRLLDRLADRAVGAPWEGPSPRAWRQRVEVAVIRADPAAARRRVRDRVAARCVRAWSNRDGTGTLQATGPAADVVDVDAVVQSLALAWPRQTPDGATLTMDQRRWHALVDVFTRIGRGQELPSVSVRREREVGIVLHEDTLFRSGPCAAEPAELRGLGDTLVLDPVTAREHATARLTAGRAVQAIVVDGAGQVRRVARLMTPAAGWSRQALHQAVIEVAEPPSTARGYVPTAAMSHHVRVASPRCSGYDCARVSRRCDLDHDEPWPRGPTAVANLDPKCRRHHRVKTRRLWRSGLRPDRSVIWTTLLGTVVSSAHEPLPGTSPPAPGAARVPAA